MLTRRQKSVVKCPSVMFRQGDVLLIRVPELPADVQARRRDRGRVVLAYGEVTGHAHAITKTDVVHYDATNPTEAARQVLASVGLTVEVSEHNAPSFLEVPTGAEVEHEEHATVALPAGRYVRLTQREYAPDTLRSVAD